MLADGRSLDLTTYFVNSKRRGLADDGNECQVTICSNW